MNTCPSYRLYHKSRTGLHFVIPRADFGGLFDRANLGFERVCLVAAEIVAVPLFVQFVKALLLFGGVNQIGFVGLYELLSVFAVIPDTSCTTAAS